MTQRPSLIVIAGAFLASIVVGFVLGVLDLSFYAEVSAGLAAAAVLTTAVLLIWMLPDQRRRARPGRSTRDVRA